MNWKNFSLWLKLGLGFGFILFLFLITSLVTIIQTNTINKLSSNVSKANKTQSLLIQKELDHFKWVNSILTTFQDENATSLTVQTDPHKCAFGKWYYSKERTEAETLIPEIKEFLLNIEKHHTALHNSAIEISDFLALNNKEEAKKTFNTKSVVQLNKVSEIISEIVKASQTKVKNIENTLVSKEKNTFWLSILLTSIAVIFGIVIAYIITKQMVTNLELAGELAKHLESRDLTFKIKVDSKDEIGKMTTALNNASGALNMTINQIKQKSESNASMAVELSASVEEVSAASNQIASSSNETNNAVETTSTAMTQMGANIQQLSKNIKNMSANFEQITLATNSGAEAVQHAIESMSGIKNSSEKIGNIVTVISEIAGQTNLLSLNAAIEAAKAGDHGKGFAVVAEEVRKLAERSANAAKEIETLINESTKQVNQGSEIIGSTGHALEEILSKVGETSSFVHEISSASEEQAKGVDEIVKSTDLVSDLSSQNASAAEEISSTISEVTRTVEELARQNEELMQDIATFKV